MKPNYGPEGIGHLLKGAPVATSVGSGSALKEIPSNLGSQQKPIGTLERLLAK